MPKYKKEKEREYLAYMRAFLVRNPDLSILGIKKAFLEVRQIGISKDYIQKLLKKIRGEKANRVEYETINVTLAQFEDEVIELKKQLWVIVNDPMGNEKAKVAAIKEIRNSSKALFDMMFDSGVFERQIGKIKTEDQISDEDMKIIEKAIKHGYKGANTENSEQEGE